MNVVRWARATPTISRHVDASTVAATSTSQLAPCAYPQEVAMTAAHPRSAMRIIKLMLAVASVVTVLAFGATPDARADGSSVSASGSSGLPDNPHTHLPPGMTPTHSTTEPQPAAPSTPHLSYYGG